MNRLWLSISLNPIEPSWEHEVNRAARTDPGNWRDFGPRAPLSCRAVWRAHIREHRRVGPLADVEAHITGTVWKIEVEVGDNVEEGDTVVILESMKMEMPVEAEDPGVVKEIVVAEGQSVSEGDTLVVLE
jgi:acetyl-CoA carboxylase biotin carboxyl carrier protein